MISFWDFFSSDTTKFSLSVFVGILGLYCIFFVLNIFFTIAVGLVEKFHICSSISILSSTE